VAARLVAVGLVEIWRGLELPLVAQALDEEAQYLVLPPLALCIFRLGVAGAGVEHQVGQDVVAGLDFLASDAVVLVELLDDDWERREGQGGQNHGSHFLCRVVWPGLYSDVWVVEDGGGVGALEGAGDF